MSVRTYVVSYIDFFEYNLISISVEASNVIDAYYKGAKEFGVDLDEGIIGELTIKDECFDQDCMMEVFGPI